MQDKQKNIIKNYHKDELTYYQKKLVIENLEKFKKLVAFDYNKMTIQKNIGNEARTFHIMDKSKPLLSPSRIAKTFTEHVFWNIPNKYLWEPRLKGQAIHKLLEISLINNVREMINIQKLEDWYSNDFFKMKEEQWSQEEINFWIDEVNEATWKLMQFLERQNIKVLAVEKHICNQNYHGFVDLLAVKDEKIPLLIDLKTTTMKEVKNTYINQLAIYNHILDSTAICLILFWDRNDKTIKMQEIDFKDLKDSFNVIDTFVKLYQ